MAKRRAILRVVTGVVGVLIPVLVMALCGGLAMVASASQESLTACLTNVSAAAATGVSAGPGLSVPSSSGPPIVLSEAQVTVARAYIGVGKSLGVSDAALQIAIMMSLQESGLRVLANSSVTSSMAYPHDGVGSDHDSLGTAQQRPSAGWGSVVDLMNPVYDAQAFFGGRAGPNHGSPPGLLDVPGWQSLSKGGAAQAVQASAYPELYAQWEGEALAVVQAPKDGTNLQQCNTDASGEATPKLPADLSALRCAIIGYAEEGVGGKYVWGGTAFKAWDCSGYVQWVYAQA